MFICPLPREKLLHFLPKGGRVVEIGTFRGEFAQQIWDTVQPDELHLIDPWCHQDREDYQTDASNLSQEGHDDNFAKVSAQFAPQIEAKQVTIHRAFSNDAAGEFEDGSVDWVYVDGLHSYEGVVSDLKLYQSKVASGGFILGHDYTNNIGFAADFGVVEAVNEFVRETEWEMVALTNEAAPSFILHRNIDGPEVKKLNSMMVYNIPCLVEVRDFGALDFQHKAWSFGEGVYRTVFSI